MHHVLECLKVCIIVGLLPTRNLCVWKRPYEFVKKVGTERRHPRAICSIYSWTVMMIKFVARRRIQRLQLAECCLPKTKLPVQVPVPPGPAMTPAPLGIDETPIDRR